MLGLDKRAAQVTWTVFLFALFVFLVWYVRESILIFVAALFLAYMLSPLVDLVCRYAPPRLSRTAALAIVYIILLVTVGALGAWVGAQAIDQGAQLAQSLPGLMRRHQDLSSLPLPSALEPFRERIAAAIQHNSELSAERVLPWVQRALGGVMNVLGSLSFIILVPILTFLFLKDAAVIRNAAVSWVAPRHRAFFDDVLGDVHTLLGQYIRALVILSVLTSIVYLIFFEMVRPPYAVLLSVLAAPLEFIPFIGPLIGTLLILLVALFTGYEHIWWIIIFFALYRAFQDYALQPYLMSSGVELHPLLVIFGALAGQQLGGLWGMFLSVPVLAILRIVLVRVQRSRTIL